ncbi:hypothetical protein GQ55_1G295400 [Panicum hallii var. hallii]|uniref:BED-type domain-containing protein n=1 Tax=Panicum hallii var. hallii TaxID=1504633 RepID=A0A2T7F8U0_9POAL|nr:hypothetical protein GQ55_1G295400 [Panicum hallii var. hallii]
MHIRPLGLSVSQQDRRWLWNRFSDLDQIVKGLLPLPALDESRQEAGTEIKDYMFLYFPELRPAVAPVRGKPLSPVWRYGEKVRRADGTTGFRCFSCHRVFWSSGVNRLRVHLEGGSAHQGSCPAVLPCTLESLARIPRA